MSKSSTEVRSYGGGKGLGKGKIRDYAASNKIADAKAVKKGKGKGFAKGEGKGKDKGEGQGENRKVRRHRNYYKFSSMISRLFKSFDNTHEMTMKVSTMAVLNSMVNDLIDRIAEEAAILCKLTKSSTLRPRNLTSALKLVIQTGDLSRIANEESVKALRTYANLQLNRKEAYAAKGKGGKEQEEMEESRRDEPDDREQSEGEGGSEAEEGSDEEGGSGEEGGSEEDSEEEEGEEESEEGEQEDEE